MGEKAYAGYEADRREAFAALPIWTRVRAILTAWTATLIVAVILTAICIGPLWAETVEVKYRGDVDLAPFDCTGEIDSSLVKRVCYSEAKAYMLISLKGTWYHYCEIDHGTVAALLAAPSKGRFYNERIKDAATDGRFGCRNKTVPEF